MSPAHREMSDAVRGAKSAGKQAQCHRIWGKAYSPLCSAPASNPPLAGGLGHGRGK